MTTAKPVRVQRKRVRGWRKPANTKCVDRSSKWGNPFRVGDPDPSSSLGEPMTAERACELYRKAIADSHAQERIKKELRGYNLACYCDLGNPYCHADILLEIANAD